MNESLHKELILQEQQKAEFCTQQSPGTYASKREFFIDYDGVMYRHQHHDRHQIIVLRSLIHDFIKANHDPKYVAHPGIKRALDLTFLRYWWPGMRKSIADFVLKCDPCQRRKEDREYTAPLGEMGHKTAPFKITSMDVTGPYLLTPRKNDLLTFIDHFTKFVEAFAIPDQTAETCKSVCVTDRHSTRHRVKTNNRSRSSFYVFIFPRDLQNFRDSQSSHYKLPSSIQWYD